MTSAKTRLTAAEAAESVDGGEAVGIPSLWGAASGMAAALRQGATVAQEASRDDTKPKVVNAVTLELSLADSEKLDLARSIGTLSLALRNQTDEATVNTAGFTRNDLLGEAKVFKTASPVKIAKPQPQPQPAKPGHCVEVIEMPDGSSRLSCFN